METTIENPVIKDDSTELRDQLRGLAEEAGPLTGNEFESEKSSAEKTETRASVDAEKEIGSDKDIKPDNSETDPEKPKIERPRDELGRFTKTEAGDDIPEAERKPVEEVKAVSDYETKKQERAQKEKERQDRSWQALDAEKERVRREAETERQTIAQERARLQQESQTRQQRPFGSKQVYEAAQDFEAAALKALNEGDYDEHGKQLTLARDAREQAATLWQAEQDEDARQQQAAFDQMYVANLQAEMQKEPDLAKEGTPLSKEVLSLLGSRDPRLMTPVGKNIFEVLPHGFSLAKEVAKMRLEAGSASGLREENQKLKAENARLNGNLSLNGSGPSGGPAPTKRLEDMSLEEMKRELRGVAESAGSLATA